MSPPLSDRSPPGATRCATPAARAAALLKEPQRLLPAPAPACSPADRPICPRRSSLQGVATRRPTSTSARTVAYHKDQSSQGRAGAMPVGAGCVRGPIVAAEPPFPVADAPAQKSPHAMCDVVWSCGRARAVLCSWPLATLRWSRAAGMNVRVFEVWCGLDADLGASQRVFLLFVRRSTSWCEISLRYPVKLASGGAHAPLESDSSAPAYTHPL